MGRTFAAPPHDEWHEEKLQVRAHSPRKRAGVSSIPPADADASKVAWAIDFQFDPTIGGDTLARQTSAR